MDIPQVGVGVMIFKDNKVLLAKRKGSHGYGEYAFPGGHLEFGESFEACAKRETKEETGLEIRNVRFLYVGNIKRYGGKHYVQIALMADWQAGEPQLLEPHKNDEWQWYELNNLPASLFETCRLAFEAYKSKRHYFDF